MLMWDKKKRILVRDVETHRKIDRNKRKDMSSPKTSAVDIEGVSNL